MAKKKVHGISDKVMGLSSPRTMFFISLEPVKVLSAKFGRTRYSKGWEFSQDVLKKENSKIGKSNHETLTDYLKTIFNDKEINVL